MDRTLQKEEALKRLDIMVSKGLLGYVKDTFDKEDLAFYSEGPGMLYWCNEAGGAPDIMMAKKKELEDKGNLVYHITHESSNFGELFDFFYVSQYDEEWEMDRADLEQGYALVDCYNVDMDLDDIGTIGWKTISGGIMRTA